MGCNKDSQLKIRNVQPLKYPAYSCKFGSACDVSIDGVRWYNYVLCGIKGVLEQLTHSTELTGLNLFVSGTIPPGAGYEAYQRPVLCWRGSRDGGKEGGCSWLCQVVEPQLLI